LLEFGGRRFPPAPRALLRAAWVVLVVALLLLGALTSWFQVGPESEGVILRLGAYTRTVGPGLHAKIPFFVERVHLVETQRQHKEEFGFRSATGSPRTTYMTGGHGEESLMLTGDLNVGVVEWIVQYRIHDPYKYLFRVRNVRETLRFLAEAVTREVVGDRTVNEVITVGRAELAIAVEEELQALCDVYETGLKIEQVILQDVTPPNEVKPSFNEVNQAQQEKERVINEARAEYNRDVPQARGRAQQAIEQAEGYALDRVNRAKGEASRFESVVREYRKAPEVTRRRIYVETMALVLPKAGRIVVVDEEAGNVIPLLGIGDGALKPLAAVTPDGGKR
jgi:membrane protease subunit HflK